MENLDFVSSEKTASIPKFKTDNLSIDVILEFYFIDTINLWRNKLDDLAKEYELSRLERRILVYIGRNPGIRQADLALIMDVEPQSLTRSLENMEQKKWLQKQDDNKDKRAKCLHLTEQGESKLLDAFKISERIRPKVLKDIADDEKMLLTRVLKQLRKNLESMI
ncbi:MarR family transcriptional regulator [Pigmentibacter sp. JX0631]|uniref:MarR family winged helix-turn-helix transcriptional regulator n=1 Tax=Pigmentibacter sp. JX0631 TaxID=2976982 RepID=UPI002468613A|nr:MarR family transcriptional regulator [Pigmentibacter sp. JX0631]WGL60201.1 MarR family transcriptional regulator [Pigmentibacter sp. JX0631]